MMTSIDNPLSMFPPAQCPLRSITESEATIATKWLETVAYSADCGKLSFSVELGS
jgi:hypothetical protein